MRGVYGVALDSVCLHSYLRKIFLVAKITYSNFFDWLETITYDMETWWFV